MDPDVWLSRPDVQEMTGWARMHLPSNSLTVYSSGGVLHAPLGNGTSTLIRDGDLRVVLDSLGHNGSRSHNIGFNLSAKHLIHQGRLYSLGGRGFWNAHSKLIEFIENTGEWELVMMDDGPHCISERGCFYDIENGVIYGIEEGKWSRPGQDDEVVWKLDLAESRWQRLGSVNPRIQLFLRSVGQVHDLTDFALWLGAHQTAILRKADGRAVMTDRWNRKIFEQASAQMKEASMSMLVVEGNRLQAFIREANAQEVNLLDWDAEAAFDQEAGRSGLMEWLTPLAVGNEPVRFEDSEVPDGERAPWPIVLWGLVLFLTVGAGFAMGRQSAKRGEVAAMGAAHIQSGNPAQGKETGAAEAELSAGAILDQIAVLEQVGAGVMSTEEVNHFLEIGEGVSSESRRAKRAQFIRDVNRVYQMRHGMDLIVREKDLNDRRRTIYVIHPHSGTA